MTSCSLHHVKDNAESKEQIISIKINSRRSNRTTPPLKQLRVNINIHSGHQLLCNAAKCTLTQKGGTIVSDTTELELPPRIKLTLYWSFYKYLQHCLLFPKIWEKEGFIQNVRITIVILIKTVHLHCTLRNRYNKKLITPVILQPYINIIRWQQS